MDASHQTLPPFARMAALVMCAGFGMHAQAASLTAIVTDRNGQPVEDVVVYAVAAEGKTPSSVTDSGEPLIMDQQFEQFEPHILVAQTGSAISFPNSDTVSHHVYSFSTPKQFELPLYQGTAHPPITFDRPGVIDVGCNIHDHMEAHIVVVDTPHFAATSAGGRAVLTNLPTGDYTMQIYSPRLHAAKHPAPQQITVSDNSDAIVQIQLEGRLRPPHSSDNESLNWSRY
jgi:plastocyanin